MAHPALERVRKLILQRFGDIDEGGSSGPAVQIFVAAADSQLGAAAIEVDLDRSSAVRQVPNDQRAGGAGGVAHRAYVVKGGRAVIDMGNGHDRGVAVDRAHN